MPVDNAPILPTTQMIKYKQKLKAQDRKPTKRKIVVEQHFDDCGDDVSSLTGIAKSVECYRDSIYEQVDHVADYCDDLDLSYVVSYLGVEHDNSNVFATIWDGRKAMDYHEYHVSQPNYGIVSYVDVAEVMGGGAYHASPRSTQLFRWKTFRLRHGC